MDRGSTGSRNIANSRGDGGQKELGSGESAHTPSTHRAGKAGCFPAHLLSRLRICVCKFFAQRIMGASRHPVFPAPSSLREGQGNEQNSGATCRENADLCVIEPREWCCQTGLNCRPLHYQWSALPLSYGSMCWDKNRPPQGAYQAGRYLPQAPLLCKLASSVKTRKSGRYRGQNAHFGSKLPAFRRFAFRSSPANWPGGHATGFGPFRVSHDPIARSLLSCRNLWAWYRRRQYRTP